MPRVFVTISKETLAILETLPGNSQAAKIDKHLCQSLTADGHKPIPAILWGTASTKPAQPTITPGEYDPGDVVG